MKKRIMNIEEKRQFQQLRAQGTRIKECAKILGYSVSTCSKLEKKRTDGILALEILTADNPDKAKDVDQLAYVLDLLTQCEQEISTRDIALLTTPKLIGTYRHYTEIALKLKKSLGMGSSTTTSEPDDLDEIWSQVARAEGPK
jgi:transposase